MIYVLEDETTGKKPTRTYINTETQTRVKTSLIYTDKAGKKWWGFTDLFKIPYIRIAYARHISDLYTMGLSLKDILGWCEAEKKLIRSDDKEKYEKLYALILEKENLAKHTADPVKQSLALSTVYILADDEQVDFFDDSIAEKKMTEWNGDLNTVAFFLSWYTDCIRACTKDLQKLSATVLKMQEQKENTLGRLSS